MRHRLISLLYILVFAPAAIEKLVGAETPTWFLRQFEPTVLGFFPQLLPLQFYGLGFLEVIAAGLFASAGMMRQPGRIFEAALATAFLCFVALGFGQRLSHKFDSAADLFFYAALTFLIYQSFGLRKKTVL